MHPYGATQPPLDKEKPAWEGGGRMADEVWIKHERLGEGGTQPFATSIIHEFKYFCKYLNLRIL